MALRAIEAILPPDNLHFVGDGFRVYGILGRREPLNHETYESIPFDGLRSSSLLSTK